MRYRLPFSLAMLLMSLLFLSACANPAQEAGLTELPPQPQPPIPPTPVVRQTLPPQGNWMLFDASLRTEQGSEAALLLFDGATSTMSRWVPEESRSGAVLPDDFPDDTQLFAFHERLLAVAPSGEYFFVAPEYGENSGGHWEIVPSAIAPDRSEVLISRNLGTPGSDEETYELFIYNWMTGERQEVTSGPGHLKLSAVWLPDGERIAFVAGDGLRLINSDGSDETTLIEEAYNEPMQGVSVSPDGHLIFGNMDGVYHVDPDSGEVTDLDAVLGGDDIFSRQRLSLSPDGQRLAFVDLGQNGEGTISLLSLDGSPAQPLVTLPTNNAHLLALGEPLDLTTDANNAGVLWSPDSEQVLFLMATPEDCFAVTVPPTGVKGWHYEAECQYGFYLVPATGGEPRLLTDYKVWLADPLLWVP